MYYLDTNIFLYNTYANPNQATCRKILKSIESQKLAAATSFETIQEIIFVTQRTKQLAKGVKVALKIFELPLKLLNVDRIVIEKYLALLKKYPTADSRDILHVASALVNNIKEIISYDVGFDKIAEIKRLDPSEFKSLLKTSP